MPTRHAPAAERRHRVVVGPAGHDFDAAADETLYAAARQAGVRLIGACGGRGSCGSCLVHVAEGRVHASQPAGRSRWHRACQVQARSDLRIEIAPRALAPIVRAEPSAAADTALPHDPAWRAIELQVSAPTLHDAAGDATRLRRAWPTAAVGPPVIDPAALATLPPLLRAHGGALQARWRVDDRRIGAFAACGSPLLGLAVDLGTTNLVAHLVDLDRGRRLASLGIENPQAGWGADLVTRLDRAQRDAATAARLQRAAADGIQALARDLADAAGAGPEHVVDVVVCGNTAMQHLLAGLPVAQLARAPFVAASLDALDLPARDLGLRLAPGATLHLAAQIGGQVGGDHVAALLATEDWWADGRTTLVMDIGTNTEITLAHRGQLRAASCPSGPALEGGHVACGMRAAEGAVEAVRIGADGRLKLRVIGGCAALGLCGSGVVDALAAFVRAGWIDRRGRITTAAAVDDGAGGRAIEIATPAGEAPVVQLTQRDVRALQLAKSAIRSGVQRLAQHAGIDESHIDRLIIAGAFGERLDIGSAIDIGLLPALPSERLHAAGHAAGRGAQQMLASRARRADARALALRVQHVELGADTAYQRTFLANLGFEDLR